LRAERVDPQSKYAKEINFYFEQSKYVPTVMSCTLLENEMKKNGPNCIFLIDGFPPDFQNYHGWKEFIQNRGNLKAVLYFDSQPEVISFVYISLV
jgi:adenylate kinase family enzyme